MSDPVCPVCSDTLPCACPKNAGADSRALRDAFGRFATGITVVTALSPAGTPVGMTVNSFTSLSLEPPLLLWCLGRQAREAEAFRLASHHCINILAADQREFSECFAGRNPDRFAGIAWQAGIGGAPVLSGCAAAFEVANERQLDGGDHLILIGRVLRHQAKPASEPLIYHAGRYARLIGD